MVAGTVLNAGLRSRYGLYTHLVRQQLEKWAHYLAPLARKAGRQAWLEMKACPTPLNELTATAVTNQ